MEHTFITILFVDDDEEDFLIVRELVREIKSYKTRIDWEPSYSKALDKAISGEYDILLVDYHLGKLSGIDLMQEAFVHGCDRPFIILTGQGEKNTDLKAIQSGASDYLQKNRLDSYVLEKAMIYAIERNKFKKELIQSQKTYKFLFEELRNKNQIINSILNSLPIVISRLDLNGRIIDIFGSGLKHIDAHKEELLEDHIDSVFCEPEVPIHEVVKNGFVSLEQKTTGENRPNTFQSYYFFNQDSADIVLFAIDVTEIKKTEEAYHQASIENRKLNKMNELLDSIIYMTAHDLRSPISNLKLITHLIEDTDEIDEKLELLDKISDSTNRMENVINGLVEIIEVQKEGVEAPRRISFEEVFEQVYEEHRIHLARLQADVQTDFQEAPDINYQEAFLISIFNNLIGNAIKYHSDKPLELRITTRRSSDYITLSVQDNGIGIDLKKYYKTIFRPFSRINDAKDGKGIGLHLIKTIVEKNGGSIEVESEPGKGSKFIINLSEY